MAMSWPVAVALLCAGLATPARATDLAQAFLVNPKPVTWTPNVLDGTVKSFAKVGNRIIVGGIFTQVQAASGGPILPRHDLFAFDANTGAIDTGFVPTVNGEVDALTAAPDGTSVFIGGAFKIVDGQASWGVAKLSVANGQVVPAFSAPTNARVFAMALSGNHLYLGGYFTMIRGVKRTLLAAVNATTGAVDPNFNLPVTVPFTPGSGPNVFKMDVTPAGDRLVIVGNFRAVAGHSRVQVALINLSATPANVASWQTDAWDAGFCNPKFKFYPTDVEFAPDGSYFVMVSDGAGYWPQTLCDTATRWATNAGPGQSPTWIDYTGGDSMFSVAITGAAIYIGGHQRWENNGPVGDVAVLGAVSRPGIAALDPQNGMPFKWNPTRTRGIGVQDMLATPTGLLVGSDTTFLGGKYHARLGMFPLAGGSVVPLGTTATLPGDLYSLPAKSCSAADVSILYRVNTGGGTLPALDCGPDWAADAAADNPLRTSGSNAAPWDPVASIDPSVPATTPSAVFSSERWDPSDAPEMQWSFPVAAGKHIQVRLYFANRYSGTSQVGQRVFNVSIDGTPVLSNFDIVADVGDQTGEMKAFNVTSDGTVNIDFSHVVENPLVDAIEIVDRDATPGPNPTPTYFMKKRAAFDGNSVPPATTFSTPGIDWSQARGSFVLNGKLYAGWSDGNLYSWTFNGTTLGTRHDVITEGNYVLGHWIDFASVTGMYWDGGRLYYTLAGDSRLFFRYFTPESELVGSNESWVSGDGDGLDWSDVRGMTEAGGHIFYATSDGDLHRIDESGGVPTPGTDTVIGGPGVDGVSYLSSGMFVDLGASLALTLSGTGGGSVVSSPAGIDCGLTCFASFDPGILVTLTASADASSVFTGWSGEGCSGTGTCQVTMSQARAVTASFDARPALTVGRSGAGGGSVVSSPPGIDCGLTCLALFDPGTPVTLTATADASSVFTGWSGEGCSGTGTCQVTMSQARTVTASFSTSNRPDGLLAYNTGVYVGNNIYNTTGAAQVRGVKMRRGGTATFRWRIQNDGMALDRIAFSAPGNSAGFLIRFYLGSANVTRAVVAGTYAKNLASGRSLTFIVKITVRTNARVGAMKSERLRATSLHKPVSDVVLARVTASR